MSGDPGDDGYKVGPGKPPRETQYKPGQSGNPGGKKKGTLNLRTAVERTFATPVPTTDGLEKPALDAILYAILVRAIGGDLRASKWLVKLCREFEIDEHAVPDAEDSASDDDIIERFVARRKESKGGGNSGE